MRASVENIFHLKCFICVVCGAALQKGDQYVLKQSQLFCRSDYEKEVEMMQQGYGNYGKYFCNFFEFIIIHKFYDKFLRRLLLWWSLSKSDRRTSWSKKTTHNFNHTTTESIQSLVWYNAKTMPQDSRRACKRYWTEYPYSTGKVILIF